MNRRELLQAVAAIAACPAMLKAGAAEAPALAVAMADIVEPPWVALPSFILMNWHGEELVRMMRVDKGPLAPGWRWRCNGLTDFVSDQELAAQAQSPDALARTVYDTFGGEKWE